MSIQNQRYIYSYALSIFKIVRSYTMLNEAVGLSGLLHPSVLNVTGD